jgi:hypothetical protein
LIIRRASGKRVEAAIAVTVDRAPRLKNPLGNTDFQADRFLTRTVLVKSKSHD